MRPMWGAYGRMPQSIAVSFVSKASLDAGIAQRHPGGRRLVPVSNTRTIGKRDMIRNATTPKIEVDPRTYEVRADGELLRCEPAYELPMAQRYALF